MDNTQINGRQVHLDFHTSPLMEHIGRRFSKENFQAALRAGNVNSITVFAKCHHSYCYFPTKVGRMHPHLDFDLLGAQIGAAHEIGVRAPVYITAGWSQADAEEHPEWIARDREGKPYGFDPASAKPDEAKPFTQWTQLCLNDGSYARHIYALTEEICARYPDLDGLFYDIMLVHPACYCAECRAGMAAEGFNAEDPHDAFRYLEKKRLAFMEKCRGILHRTHPGASIFFNGMAELAFPQFHAANTHYEMEDLPTAWGGYNKMPLRARLFEGSGKPFLGMTGKFHLAWGEFGGYKPPEALKYEIALMAAYGACASIGDHLLPEGEMDLVTYENIGVAYRYQERIAPYSFGGRPVTAVGLYLPGGSRLEEAEGTAQMLLEAQIDFGVVREDNFADFSLCILPGGTKLTDAGLAKLRDYLAGGGKVIFCGDALVRDGTFQIPCGLRYLSAPTTDCDYLLPTEALGGDLPRNPFLSYSAAHRVEVTDGEVLASALPPIFSRTQAHYCGHRNTPYATDGERYPAMVRSGNTVYFAHRIASVYLKFGSVYYRRYFLSALRALGFEPPVRVRLGSEGRATLRHQPDARRYCLHLLYASPVRRGDAWIIDDITPLYDIPVRVRVPERVCAVRLLDGGELAFSQENGEVAFTVPHIEGHALVVMEYAE